MTMPTTPVTYRRIRPMPDLADYMTTKETADKLGLHVHHVRFLVREGKLKAIKAGPIWLVSRESAEHYRKATEGMSKRDPRRKDVS